MQKVIVIVVNKANFFLSHRLNFALELKKKGFQIHILSDGTNYDVEKIRNHGLFFHQINFSRVFNGLFFEIKTIWNLYFLYKSIKPDVIHHVTIKPIIYGNFICKVLGKKKIINSISGLGFLFIDKSIKSKFAKYFIIKMYKSFFKGASKRVILQNEDEYNFLLKNNISNRENLRLIPGAGVNTNIFKPSNEINENRNIVFAARMIKDKGAEELVEAVIKLNEEKFNISLILLGGIDKEYPSHIEEERLIKWSKNKFIKWLGHTNDILSYYQKAFIVCMPSYYSEGVPKSLIEAASVGKPIITTDMPGCRSIVKNNYNGILVRPKNIEDIVRAVKFFINNPDKVNQYGKNGRELVKQKFDEKIIVESTIKIYEELVG
jgi:glycosyltransferase involved in cell wall biosynthesis